MSMKSEMKRCPKCKNMVLCDTGAPLCRCPLCGHIVRPQRVKVSVVQLGQAVSGIISERRKKRSRKVKSKPDEQSEGGNRKPNGRERLRLFMKNHYESPSWYRSQDPTEMKIKDLPTYMNLFRFLKIRRQLDLVIDQELAGFQSIDEVEEDDVFESRTIRDYLDRASDKDMIAAVLYLNACRNVFRQYKGKRTPEK